MNETSLKNIEGLEEKIRKELEPLKKDLENIFKDGVSLYTTIKKYEPDFDIKGLLKRFDKKAGSGNTKSEKITVSISRILPSKGMKESEIISSLKHLKDKTPEDISKALNKVKTKAGSKDSFIYKDGLFFSKPK